MAQTGRNEPCPCGSGKKYKACHGKAAPEAQKSSWHELDSALIEAMGRFLGSKSQRALPIDATFPYEPTEADEPLFVAWSAYEMSVRGEQRMVDVFLEERGASLSPRERTWLEANKRAWLSMWQVTSVDPGHGMTMVDRLTGAEREVHEVTASRSIRAGDCVLTRVVDIEGVSVLCGMHPRGLTAEWGARFVEEVHYEHRVRKKPMAVKRVRAIGVAEALIGLWQDVVDSMDAQPVPELRNTDGDRLLQTTDHFMIAAGARDAVVAALSSIEGAHARERAGMHEILLTRGHSVIGVASVSAAKMSVESMSIARADEARALIEALLAKAELSKKVTHRARSHEDVVAHAMEKAAAGASVPERDLSAEEAEVVRATKLAHYAKWVDEALPALGGKTPREAAGNKKLRAKLKAMLTSIEHIEAADPEETRFDVGVLRRELGV